MESIGWHAKWMYPSRYFTPREERGEVHSQQARYNQQHHTEPNTQDYGHMALLEGMVFGHGPWDRYPVARSALAPGFRSSHYLPDRKSQEGYDRSATRDKKEGGVKRGRALDSCDHGPSLLAVEPIDARRHSKGYAGQAAELRAWNDDRFLFSFSLWNASVGFLGSTRDTLRASQG